MPPLRCFLVAPVQPGVVESIGQRADCNLKIQGFAQSQVPSQ